MQLTWGETGVGWNQTAEQSMEEAVSRKGEQRGIWKRCDVGNCSESEGAGTIS